MFLDGFCEHPPAHDPQGRYRNFDHHVGPPRPDMLCTAQQVRRAIQMGILDDFMRHPGDDAHVWINDPDQDVCLAVLALKHPSIVGSFHNPAVSRLYGHLDNMDMSCGLWPVGEDVPIVGQSAWVFEPYWEFRISGALDQRSVAAYRAVIGDVGRRAMEFISGRGRSLPYNDEMEVLHRGPGWIMIREVGQHARMTLMRMGYRAFVSARQSPTGTWFYTLCRFSPHTWRFPVPQIAAHINKDEKQGSHFGGGDIVFANSRGEGSKRSPDQMAKIIDGLLQDQKLTAT